jgi:hypothetical protein
MAEFNDPSDKSDPLDDNKQPAPEQSPERPQDLGQPNSPETPSVITPITNDMPAPSEEKTPIEKQADALPKKVNEEKPKKKEQKAKKAERKVAKKEEKKKKKKNKKEKKKDKKNKKDKKKKEKKKKDKKKKKK